MDNPNPTEQQWHAQFLVDALQRGAAGYRELADRLDRLTVTLGQVPSTAYPRYSDIAQAALSEVRSTLGNAAWAESAVSSAALADVALAVANAKAAG